MPELTILNVFKHYDDKRKRSGKNKAGLPSDYAVKDFSLSCREGEFFGILGAVGLR